MPKEIIAHPCVKRDAKKRKKKAGEILLDSSLHHSAMLSLKGRERRGRPDIVHISMLIALESILNKEGMLSFTIHTRNNELIYVDPKMRVIKNYNRFKGLMEQLFLKKVIPSPENPLMKMEKKSLLDALKEKKGKIILLSREGKRKPVEEVLDENVTCIIGGFPHGDFISPVKSIADEVISIHPSPLPAWIAVMECICAYERFIGI